MSLDNLRDDPSLPAELIRLLAVHQNRNPAPKETQIPHSSCLSASMVQLPFTQDAWLPGACACDHLKQSARGRPTCRTICAAPRFFKVSGVNMSIQSVKTLLHGGETAGFCQLLKPLLVTVLASAYPLQLSLCSQVTGWREVSFAATAGSLRNHLGT